MSYISCDNSALLPPPGYIAGSIGYTFSPVVNTTPVNSTATLATMAGYTVPVGKWLVSGVLSFDATVGGQTLTGNVAIDLDGVALWRYSFSDVADGKSVILSAVFSSDGTTVLTIPAVMTTSGGAQYQAITANASSLIEVTRIA